MIDVEEVRDSRVMAVSAEYPDPVTAQDIANAVVRAAAHFLGQVHGEYLRGSLTTGPADVDQLLDEEIEPVPGGRATGD